MIRNSPYSHNNGEIRQFYIGKIYKFAQNANANRANWEIYANQILRIGQINANQFLRIELG